MSIFTTLHNQQNFFFWLMSTRHRSQTFIIKVSRSRLEHQPKYPVSPTGFRPPDQNPSAPVRPLHGTKKWWRQHGAAAWIIVAIQNNYFCAQSLLRTATSWRVRFQSLTWMESETQGDTQQYPVVFHSYNSMGLAGKVSQSLFDEDKRVDSLRRALQSWGKLTAGWYTRT